MVFLALSRHGYESYIKLSCTSFSALWVAAGVLSSEELKGLRESGTNVTDFNYTIEPNETDVISGAVETIKEHHPHEAIWVEA